MILGHFSALRRISQMSPLLVVVVTQRRLPSVQPVKCSAALESVFTKNGGVMETLTARMAVTRPIVVSADHLSLIHNKFSKIVASYCFLLYLWRLSSYIFYFLNGNNVDN